MADVVCLGLLVADVFASPLDAVPSAGELSLIEKYLLTVGGCAANTAADLVRLGRTSSVLGKVGDDHFGDFVLKELRRLGVDPSFVTRSPTHPTSCTFIMNVRGQDRRYIHCMGANAHFSIEDIAWRALDGVRAIYLGGFFAMPSFRPERLVQLFRKAKQRRLMTVLDVVIPAGTTPTLDDLREVLAITDAFLPNSDEARVLTGRTEPLEQADALARVNPACTIVITMGRGGAIARRKDQIWRVGAFKVDSVDESGAGDAFDAGFLVGMLEGWPLEDSLKLASAVGASCTRAMGCHDGFFTFEEARAWIAQNHLELTKVA